MNTGKCIIRSDSHMHTCFSSDSEASVESMLNAAASVGLHSVCITDHLDLDYPPDEELGDHPFLLDVDEYFRVLTDLRERYKDKIEVRIGVEIGLQEHLGREYHQLVNRYPFDFVIGSLHLVCGEDPYNGRVFQGKSDAKVYREAFRETLRNLEKTDDFDVLGHLDYVVRYGKHQAEEYTYAAFADEIDAVLRKLIDMGKGLELNMAGMKYGLGFANPHPDVLKRYRELGGEIVTVGADAHKPEHVAYDFHLVPDILETCGFRYYTEFRNRKPFFVPAGSLR